MRVDRLSIISANFSVYYATREAVFVSNILSVDAMKHNLHLVIIASLWANSSATDLVNNLINIPKIGLGRCPSVDTVPNFDTGKYLGAWYSQMQVPSTFQPADMTCVRALYGDRGDGTVSVYNTGTNGKGVLVEICGYAYQPDPADYPGKLAVK